MIKAKKQGIEEPLINLTPLIDVVFVILIMFILIAPLIEFDEIELAQASAKSQEKLHPQQTSPIVIQVKQDNAIILNNKKISFKDLAPSLIKLKKTYPSATPQIFHDKKAYFGTYQVVKNAVEDAGFEKMDLVLNPH